MQRGFTIVELIVVIIVLTILAAIVTSSYTKYQDRSFDAQAKGLAASVRAGVERHFNRHNEYPSAEQMFGGTPTGSIPSSYTAANSLTDVPLQNLDGPNAKLLPCAGATTTCLPASTDKAKVYYLTKLDSDDMAARSYTLGSCTYTFPNTELPRASFVLLYWSNQQGLWKIAKSNHGSPQTSDNVLCPFTEL